MKFQNSKKIIAFVCASILAFANFACQKAQTTTANQAAETTSSETATVKASSPTEAYKLLFAAVKAKDAAKIRQLMSKRSLVMAEGAAKQFGKSLDEQLENGALDTTFAAVLPEIRDERVKDNFGAVEVFNDKTKNFDDTYFILEDGGWKMAFGDAMSGTYKSPGKGRAQLEMEAANPMNPDSLPHLNIKPPPANMNSIKPTEIPTANINKSSAATPAKKQ